MSEFKVGDQVEIVETDGIEFSEGETVTLVRFDPDDEYWPWLARGEEQEEDWIHGRHFKATERPLDGHGEARFLVDSEGVATDNLALRSAVYFKPEGGEWQQIGHVDPDSFKTVESPSRELSYSFTISNPLPGPELLQLYTGYAAEQIAAVTATPPQFILGDEPEPDEVNSPSHYTAGMPEGVEVIDVIRSQGWDDNYYMGNVLKYILRAEHKGNRLQDLQKAAVYLQWEIERAA